MPMRDQIEAKLRAAFDPKVLEVIDDSESHRGHAGYREGGESHFNVKIRASAFVGMNRVQTQRAIYKALAEEMRTTIHALALDAAAAD